MNKNYLKEIKESSNNQESIDDFHYFCLSYLGENFFSDKNAKILDIGAGLGHSLLPLKKFGWNNLYAVDIDNFNQDFFKKNDIDFNLADIERNKLPYEDNFFDVVLTFHVVEHLQSPNNFLNEIYRVLKKGGILILVTPDWRKQYKIFWRDHTHVHPYDKESINRLVKCFGFIPLKIQSFGVLRGFGRLKIWKLIKSFMFTGIDLIIIAKK